MAITAAPGEPLISYITLLNTDGSGISGETWVTVETEGPNGEEFVVEVTELGGGHYIMRADETDLFVPGEWFARVEGVTTGRSFVETWDVVDYNAYELENIDGPTLQELRAILARQNGDYRKVEALESSDGSMLYNDFDLAENTDFFRGAEVLCVSGNPANVGQRRKVIRSSYENSMVEFSRKFPDAILEGDQFEFFNFSIRIPRKMSEYDNAINDAIRSGWPQNRLKVYVDPLSTFDKDSNGFTLPGNLTHVYDVKFLVDDVWYDVPPSRYLGETGWFVDGARRRLHLGGGYQWMADGKQIRIYGYARPKILTLETDRTTTDTEWIIDTASGALLTAQLDQATFPIGQSRINRADQLRAKMVKTPEPNTVALT